MFAMRRRGNRNKMGSGGCHVGLVSGRQTLNRASDLRLQPLTSKLHPLGIIACQEGLSYKLQNSPLLTLHRDAFGSPSCVHDALLSVTLHRR